MKCIKEVVCNGELVNTIESEGENAYKELSILLMNKVNKKRVSIHSTINQRGLHELVGLQKISDEYVYQYKFLGDDIEALPII